MVVLASTFLDTSLLTSHSACNTPLAAAAAAQRPQIPSLSIPSASLQNAEEQQTQHKKSPTPSSWISFFLSGSSQKAPKKPLLEDMGSSQVDGTTTFQAVTPTVQEPAKISTKKGARGAKRTVTFTPQKARELREKLKGTDSFHDFMYHSAIASRLASNDS